MIIKIKCPYLECNKKFDFLKDLKLHLISFHRIPLVYVKDVYFDEDKRRVCGLGDVLENL
jgi:hypothetical protein